MEETRRFETLDARLVRETLNALHESRKAIEQTIADIGPCEHDAGICHCGLTSLALWIEDVSSAIRREVDENAERRIRFASRLLAEAERRKVEEDASKSR